MKSKTFMQQFVVPQFIDIEDKIFGPITVRQFLILLIGGLLNFLSFKLADFALFVILLTLFSGLSLVFAFVKVNGQTFHYFLLNLFQTAKKPSLRIWKKSYSKEELEFFRTRGLDEEIPSSLPTKTVKHERIRDLSLIVNTGGYYRPEEMG